MKWYQKWIRYIGYLLLGIVLFGQLLDAIANAESLITPTSAKWLTAGILLLWAGIEAYLYFKPIYWNNDKNRVRIKRLGIKTRLPILGAILLLWIPYLVKEDTKPIETTSSDCIKPFESDSTFKILLLPLKKGAFEYEGDYMQQVEQKLEDIVETNQLEIEVYYHHKYLADKSFGRKEANGLLECSGSNIVVYGDYWYNKNDELMGVNFEYVDDDVFPDYKLSNESKKISNDTLLNLMPLPDFENLFFSSQVKRLKEIEQAVYWLATLNELKKENLERSLLFINKAVSLDTSNTDLRFIKIFILSSENRYEEALRIIDNNSIINQSEEGILFKTMILSHLGKLTEKNEILNNFLLKVNNKGSLQRAVFIKYLTSTNENEIRDFLNRINILIRNDSCNLGYRILRTMALFPLDSLNSENFINDVQFILAEDSLSAIANTIAGNYYYDVGQFKKAIFHFNIAIANEEDKDLFEDDKLNMHLKFENGGLYNNRASLYFEMDSMDLALNDIEKAITLAPKNPFFYHNKSRIFSKSPYRNNETIIWLKKAIEVDTSYYFAYGEIARYYVQNDSLNKAIEYGKKAIHLEPEYKLALDAVGTAYMLKNNFNKAIEYGTKIIELYEDHTMGYAIAGRGYLGLNRFKKARKLFDKALNLNSESVTEKELKLVYTLMYFYYSKVDSLRKAYEFNESFMQKLSDKNRYISNQFELLSMFGDHTSIIYMGSTLLQSTSEEISSETRFKIQESIEVSTLYACVDISDQYNAILEVDPNHLTARISRALFNACSGKSEDAIEDASLFLRVMRDEKRNQSDEYLAYRSLALAYGHKGDYEKAIENIERSIELTKQLFQKTRFSISEGLNAVNPERHNIGLIEALLAKVDICYEFKKLECVNKTLEELNSFAPDYLRVMVYNELMKSGTFN